MASLGRQPTGEGFPGSCLYKAEAGTGAQGPGPCGQRLQRVLRGPGRGCLMALTAPSQARHVTLGCLPWAARAWAAGPRGGGHGERARGPLQASVSCAREQRVPGCRGEAGVRCGPGVGSRLCLRHPLVHGTKPGCRCCRTPARLGPLSGANVRFWLFLLPLGTQQAPVQALSWDHSRPVQKPPVPRREILLQVRAEAL